MKIKGTVTKNKMRIVYDEGKYEWKATLTRNYNPYSTMNFNANYIAIFLQSVYTKIKNRLEVLKMVKTTELLKSLVPITQFNRGQASRIFDRLHTEPQLIVLKNNQPSAVILSPMEYERLAEIEEEYNLLMEANRRLAQSADKPTYSFSEVLSEFDISEQDLKMAEDVEFE